MQYINPLNFLGTAILGAALLWAVKLAYGRRRAISDDLVKRLMLLAGWMLLLVGTVGVVVGLSGPFAPVPLLGAVVAAVGYFKYMTAERRALLWALAVAAEKGIPLEQAARAFAEERGVQIGVRVSHLADMLESGVPLPLALDLTRNPLPADALLAARLGQATGRLGAALRMSIRHSEMFDRTMREAFGQIFYLVGVLVAGTIVVSFVMLKIVPVYAKIFSEFGLDLPEITQWMIAIASQSVYAIPVIYPALLIMLLLVFSYFVRWSRYELPGLNRFWLRSDGALVMRALSFAVQQGRELGPAVRLLAEQYPRPSVARRLERAAAGIDRGANWCDALQSERLLTATDAALLKAAQRVGNLAWALEEMSEGSLRRWAFRWKILVDIAFPLLILALGLLVMFIVVGLFVPLVSLIQGLS
jgi:type II secretory pathway component PulF